MAFNYCEMIFDPEKRRFLGDGFMLWNYVD